MHSVWQKSEISQETAGNFCINYFWQLFNMLLSTIYIQLSLNNGSYFKQTSVFALFKVNTVSPFSVIITLNRDTVLTLNNAKTLVLLSVLERFRL